MAQKPFGKQGGLNRNVIHASLLTKSRTVIQAPQIMISRNVLQAYMHL